MPFDMADAPLLVRRAREDAGMSQRALASMAGVKQPNLAAIESGTRTPTPESLESILRAARLRPSVVLEIFAERVRTAAASHGLHDLRVFGSTVAGADHEGSDVDLLVRADDDVDFLRLAAFRVEAAEILGFPVDVVVDDGDFAVLQAIRAAAVPL